MTLIESRLQELLHAAAPESGGVELAEVSRRGRRLQRRRRALITASAVMTGALVVSLAAVIGLPGHSDKATVSPLPVTGSNVTSILTPASGSATPADLHADAAVLTRRLAAAGINGKVEVGIGSIKLHLPASAAGSLSYLAGAGKLSFRIPAAVEKAPSTPTPAAGSCVSAAGPATGSPPSCITARLSSSCPKPGTAEGFQIAGAPATDWIVACDANGVEYALGPQRLGGDAVSSAAATLDDGANGVSTGQWIVSVKFTQAGQADFTDLTAAISSTAGCPASSSAACALAIVVDGVVQSAPIIQVRIDGSAQIAGSFTEQSAKALAAALSNGTLPVPLTVSADSGAGSSGPSPTRPATKSTGPTAAKNKAAAQAETDKLVSMAALPPGAVRVKSQPVGLAGPALGTPVTSQLIDSVRYYSDPMSPAQAYAWLRVHPPQGLTQSGSVTGGGAVGSSTYGFEYDPTTPAHWSWGSASLEIGMTAQGSTTVIRVDGLAQWIDPSPVHDSSKGPELRVTIAGGCPATDRGFTDISNPGVPDLDHQLLPAAAPTAALKCVYNGLNGDAFALEANQRLSAKQASAAAAEIRAQPLGSRGLGTHSCPSDDARASILAFSYPGRADVDIWEKTSGCTSTDNGYIIAGSF